MTQKLTPQASFVKPMTPSPELAIIVGANPLTRTEAVKRVWTYVHHHGLQDHADKKLINADDVLQAICGGKTHVSMFEMTRLVNKHLDVRASRRKPPHRCPSRQWVPPKAIERVPEAQAGAGRHRCAACAYAAGYEAGLEEARRRLAPSKTAS